MTQLLSVGEFARLTHVSVKALHHYHEVDLLVPAVVDAESGYRRYTTSQVPVAQLVRRLRDLDMPLPGIRRVLDSPADERNTVIAAHLRLMESELDRTRAAVRALRLLLDDPVGAIPVEHRTIEAVDALVVERRAEHASIDQWCAQAFAEIASAMRGPAAGPAGALYPDTYFADGGGDVVAFLPVAAALRGSRPVAGGAYAVALHLGGFADLDRTYGALGSYVAARGVGAAGPIRERYLVTPADSPDPADWRTRGVLAGDRHPRPARRPFMIPSIAHVTVDSVDAAAAAAFWASLLDLAVDDGANPFFATVGRGDPAVRPGLMFIQVPEPRTTKNRVHLDLLAADREAAVQRAVMLGATRVADFDEYGARWTSLQDPEGNEFDIGQA